MSRPATLNPMAKKAVRICYQADPSFTQTVLGEIFGCSRDSIARTVAGLSHTPEAVKRVKGEKE